MRQLLTALPKEGWILLQRSSAEGVNDRAHVPQTTCANPFCFDFNQPLQLNEYRLSIDPLNTHLVKTLPSHPLADLATVRASSISGEANLRGKGERDCLWMHVTCAEHLGIGQLNHIDCIRMEHSQSDRPQIDSGLESPGKYALLKWVAE